MAGGAAHLYRHAAVLAEIERFQNKGSSWISALVVLGLSLLVFVGAGAAQRISAVKWNVVGRILSAWVITLPCTAVAGGIIYLTLREIHELF